MLLQAVKPNAASKHTNKTYKTPKHFLFMNRPPHNKKAPPCEEGTDKSGHYSAACDTDIIGYSPKNVIQKYTKALNDTSMIKILS